MQCVMPALIFAIFYVNPYDRTQFFLKSEHLIFVHMNFFEALSPYPWTLWLIYVQHKFYCMCFPSFFFSSSTKTLKTFYVLPTNWTTLCQDFTHRHVVVRNKLKCRNFVVWSSGNVPQEEAQVEEHKKKIGGINWKKLLEF